MKEFYLKKAEEYKIALLAHFEVINLAAKFQTAIAEREPLIEYWRRSYYDDYIERNRTDLVNLSKSIDQDVRVYWNGSLDALETKHKYLCKEYTDKTRKYRRKTSYELFGAPNLARLNIAEKDIRAALAKIPIYDFSDSSHVKYWRDTARLCCPVIIDTYEMHSQIVDKIKDIDYARSEKIRTRVGFISGLLSPAIAAAKLFIGAPL